MLAYTQRRIRTLLIAQFVCLLTGGVLLAQTSAEELGSTDRRSEPAGIGEMIETDKAILMFESRIKSDHDFLNRTVLGRLYLRRAKETGDHGDYRKAERILSEAVAINPRYKPAVIYLANALAACHRFKLAIELIEPLLEETPKDPVLLASVGDAKLQIGQYDQAARLYDRLSQLSDAPAVLARQAHVNELDGNTDSAIEKMKSAVKRAAEYQLATGEQAWYAWRLAGLQFSVAQFNEAGRSLRNGLELSANDAACMNLLSKVLLAQNDLNGAIKNQLSTVQLHGEPPAMGLLGDLYHLSGDNDEARKWWDQTEQAMRDEAVHAESEHLQEYGMFLADHNRRITDALDMTERNLELRQDIYSYDALAWALYRNGRFQEANTAMENAMRLGTQDATLFLHAAAIHAKLGNDDESRKLREAAERINPVCAKLVFIDIGSD